MKQLVVLVLSLYFIVLSTSLFGKDPDENKTKISSTIHSSIGLVDTCEVFDTSMFSKGEMIDEIFGLALDSLVNDWYVRNAFHVDSFSFRDTCVNHLQFNENGEPVKSSKFPPLPDSVYIQRLQAIDSHIDLSYNSIVRDVIVLYSGRRKNQVSVMLGLANYYFPLFEEIFDQYQLPLELKYLAIIESALNPRNFSRAGACGLWQFMLGTGRMYGLEVNTFIDERRDPRKSTDAAARYLKELYAIYGDWHMAIAAYNCGPGNVNKAIKRTGGKSSYWDIYYYLPKETRTYVPAYIAASYIMNYYKTHGIQPLKPGFPIITDTIMIGNYLHLKQVADKLNIDINVLREINPIYRRDVIPARPEKPYPLYLPIEQVNNFIEIQDQVFAHERNKFFPNNQIKNPGSMKASAHSYTPPEVSGKDKVMYTVKSGDNVGFISEWFNIRIADLRYWNDLRGNLIREGQNLVIYVPKGKAEYYSRFDQLSFNEKQLAIGKTMSASSSMTKPSNNETERDNNYVYHTVRSGDNLWEIAKKYPGVTAEDIRHLNDISNTRGLTIGQTLKIKPKN
jgi:membrane-bound lytic murein transglycosylase D